MVSKNFLIKNKSGLHVRPAGILVKVIQPFGCDVVLKYKDKEYNAKSVLGIMSACIKAGEEVEFTCNGENEEGAIKAIEEAIESGLGE
ncbi:MAG: HPr family phosphocarrier protein [Clostridiales bacterium]|jgi:phosphocarrier protein|nr:HPr family phosphocarrier protein [Clostridiales bacterium]